MLHLGPSQCSRAGPCEDGERSQQDSHRHTGSRSPVTGIIGIGGGASRGPLILFQLQPAFLHEAAALRERRGRKPPLSPDSTGRLTALVGPAVVAQSRRPPVSRTALGLRAQAARAGAFTRSFAAGPFGAETLSVRHVPDLGHAPTFMYSYSCI
ncbi:hypothetical protein NDU88_001131 [Pleurodeles waltl]|uniref:Uncharacterized protein n=1 Tax=Pleurodeles waltl TaxID=8319 RepID=A0AAV7Q277_PLEWA|nr:hypothetical protein NDU88_001131 [Pleurodeles waltl]